MEDINITRRQLPAALGGAVATLKSVFSGEPVRAAIVPSRQEGSFLKDVERMERAWNEHVRAFVEDIEEQLKQPPQQDFWHDISPSQQQAVLNAIKSFVRSGRTEGYIHPYDVFRNAHNKNIFQKYIEAILRVQDMAADTSVTTALFINNFIRFLFKDAPAE